MQRGHQSEAERTADQVKISFIDNFYEFEKSKNETNIISKANYFSFILILECFEVRRIEISNILKNKNSKMSKIISFFDVSCQSNLMGGVNQSKYDCSNHDDS